MGNGLPKILSAATHVIGGGSSLSKRVHGYNLHVGSLEPLQAEIVGTSLTPPPPFPRALMRLKDT